MVQDARWLGRTRANFGKKGGADIRLSQQNGVVFVVHHSVIIKGIQFQLIQYQGVDRVDVVDLSSPGPALSILVIWFFPACKIG